MSSGGASAHSDHDIAIAAEAIHSAAIHLLRRLRREDDASGLTGPRLSALSVIVFGGPIALGTLAAAEQVRAPTMTRLVAALEADGLVAREPDPRDGRGVLVHATAAGRQLLEEGRTRRTSVLVRQLSSLAPEELATLCEAAAIMERLARGAV
jgi:DNA-binding MarR family transcriptional regulator